MARPNEDGNIVCTGCEKELPANIKYFHRHRDAFKPRCKECRGSSFGVHDPNKVIDTPEGEKICSKCNKLLPADVEHFYRTNKNDGFASNCKKCHSSPGEYGINRPNVVLDIPEGYWHCKSCDSTLPLNREFFYEYNGKFEPYCKPCSIQRKNQYRRDYDGLTGKQWKLIKAEWLVEGVVVCAYCGDEAKNPERDHVQPLSSGGKTHPHNIVPSCTYCNRSKANKPVSEWYPESGVFDPVRWDKIQEHLKGNTEIENDV